jgi:hypothetical protein
MSRKCSAVHVEAVEGFLERAVALADHGAPLTIITLSRGSKVYVDVQNQGAWPSGKRAKFSHGPCDNRDAEFNFDPQIIAVAEEMLLHRLDCLD